MTPSETSISFYRYPVYLSRTCSISCCPISISFSAVKRPALMYQVLGVFLLQADVLFKCSILAFVSFNLFVFSRNDLCARTRFGEAMHANTFISGLTNQRVRIGTLHTRVTLTLQLGGSDRLFGRLMYDRRPDVVFPCIDHFASLGISGILICMPHAVEHINIHPPLPLPPGGTVHWPSR